MGDIDSSPCNWWAPVGVNSTLKNARSKTPGMVCHFLHNVTYSLSLCVSTLVYPRQYKAAQNNLVR